MTSNELEIFKQSILDDVRVMMQTTGQVTQYIGARYVPLFAEPLDWNIEREYEPLTIVLNQGNSYTSRQFVPKGVDISDTAFWANTGNYNAQIEQYRQEVEQLKVKVDNNVYIIDNFKEKNDGDYSNAFSKIMRLINANGGGTVMGRGRYNGELTINTNNVTLIGGVYTNTLTIDVPGGDNATPSNINIKSCMFETGDNNGVILGKGTGIKITDCEFKQTKNASGIFYNGDVEFNQQLKQTIISNCRFYGGYSVYINGNNTGTFKYLSSDTIITNCEMVNLIGNVYMTATDGCVISNNTMFLSLGGADKMDNIYLDNASMMVISNNQLFESGRCAIYIGVGQNGSITGNNIIWPCQYKRLSGIYVGKKIVGNESNLGNISICNNIIDHPCGDGIKLEKELIYVNGNAVSYAGSSDHWKGSDSSSGDYYVINALVKNIFAFTNSAAGNDKYNLLDTKNIANNVNVMNFGGNEKYYSSYRYFGMSDPIDISDGTPVKYTSDMPMLIVVNKSSIDKSVLIGDSTNAPKIGCIMCYQQNCTIDEHILKVQKPELFLIYGGNINWLNDNA